MKNLISRNLTLDDVPQVEAWLLNRFETQGRYAGRAFKYGFVGMFIEAAEQMPNDMLTIGTFDGDKLTGVFCGAISDHPFFDCKVAANVAYQAEGASGSMLIDAFTEWAVNNGAHEILIGMSAHPQKHEAYKRLMRKQGYFDSDLMFYKVV